MEMIHERSIREPLRNPISWGAAIGGFVIATGLQILLNSFGAAIGLTVINPFTGVNATAFGVGAALWTLIMTFVSIFVGAWVAARYSFAPAKDYGLLQGALVWGLSFALSTTMMATGVGTTRGLMGRLAGLDVQTESTVLSMERTSRMNPGRGGSAAGDLRGDVRERNVAALMQAGNLTREQAERMVDRLPAETATKVASAVAWWFFLTALLSLIGGLWAGHLGSTNRPDLQLNLGT